MILSGLLVANLVQAMSSEELQKKIKTLSPTGCVILHDESGKEIVSINPRKALIPASIIKIITASAVYDLLGKDFRFKTDFYLIDNSLGIKGWGDPFLISEEIALIVSKLKPKLPKNINGIYLDNSSFAQRIVVPGKSKTLNPYDAINGALVVNFNTLNVGKSRKGEIYSAEEVTPLTPLARIKADQLQSGKKERINLTENPEESLRYVGELFAAFLEQDGLTVDGDNLQNSSITKRWHKIYSHYNTRSLDAIFTGLMKYSNNFIANQAFLVLGAEKKGYPASLDKSKVVLQGYLKQKWGFNEEDLYLEEASGISRNNRMTGEQMMTVLESFRPNSYLLSEKKGIKIKSGTLTGVYNYAGYFTTSSGIRPFVIMTNQSVNQRDRILKILRNISTTHK